MNRHFPGKWRIAKMEDFAQADVDLCGPAFIAFDEEGRLACHGSYPLYRFTKSLS
jgi:hypothetical protein